MSNENNTFICCTPYHIFLSVHLVRTLYTENKNNIFICNHFPGAESIYKKIKTSQLFNNVNYVEDYQITYSNKVIKGIHFLKKNFLNIDPIEINENSNLFLFTYNYFSYLMADQFISRKNKIIIVEEGLMTYWNNFESFSNSIVSILFKIFNRNYMNEKSIQNLLLFEPSLYADKEKFVINQIPAINMEDEDFINLLNEIFGYTPKKNMYKERKFIFFDQSFTTDGLSKYNDHHLLALLNDNPVSKELLVKKHPRDLESKYLKYKNLCITNDTSPWELIYLNECRNLTNTIFIAVNSSAVFTPRIIFKKNHKIILLEKILNSDQNDLLSDFIRKFKLFIQQENVFEPSSFQELIILINKLTGEKDNADFIE